MEAQEYELWSEKTVKLIYEIKKRGLKRPLFVVIVDIIGNGDARDYVHAQAPVGLASSL